MQEEIRATQVFFLVGLGFGKMCYKRFKKQLISFQIPLNRHKWVLFSKTLKLQLILARSVSKSAETNVLRKTLKAYKFQVSYLFGKSVHFSNCGPQSFYYGSWLWVNPDEPRLGLSLFNFTGPTPNSQLRLQGWQTFWPQPHFGRDRGFRIHGRCECLLVISS